MNVLEKLNEIDKLGFWVSIDWGTEIGIYKNANDVIPASAYAVQIIETIRRQEEKFEDTVERICDKFFEWYKENENIVNQFDENYDMQHMEKLEKASLRWYDYDYYKPRG